MHWVRDTVWREDVSKIRTGAASGVMASLRNAVLEIWPEGPAEHHRKPAPKADGPSRWRYKRPKDIRIRTILKPGHALDRRLADESLVSRRLPR